MGNAPPTGADKMQILHAAGHTNYKGDLVWGGKTGRMLMKWKDSEMKYVNGFTGADLAPADNVFN